VIRKSTLRSETELADFEFLGHVLNHMLTTDVPSPNKTSREKRNIFGDAISLLTGLVTQDKLTGEHEQVLRLRDRVKSILDTELELEHVVQNVSREAMSKDTFIKVFTGIKHRVEANEKYRSRKGGGSPPRNGLDPPPLHWREGWGRRGRGGGEQLPPSYFRTLE
jgi:hypothetical protein